ncbi:MAG: hypothetical protein KatS3mg112_0341 [Thermogutta sp.]|nr:MAG: hypothetical protein KatS3mg112_0341 [Thermogutta sp.]
MILNEHPVSCIMSDELATEGKIQREQIQFIRRLLPVVCCPGQSTRVTAGIDQPTSGSPWAYHSMLCFDFRWVILRGHRFPVVSPEPFIIGQGPVEG